MRRNAHAVERRDAPLALAAFAAACAAYAIPLLNNPGFWGGRDFDQFAFWNEVPRETLLRWGQFPSWNPFSNGGNAMLAMPHSSFLSPLYLPVLLAGPVVGLKLAWLAGLLLGLLGAWRLARRLGLGPLSSLLPPLVLMLSSHYALHVREGHAEWAVLGLVPWACLFALDARASARAFALAALTLALMILSGGVYAFAVTVAFFSFYALAQAALERSPRLPAGLAGLLLLVFLLAGVKLVPMLQLLRDSPRPTKDAGRLEAVLLPKVFLLRGQNALYEDRAGIAKRLGMNWDRENWHEFGVYTGAIPLLLALYGWRVRGREHRALAWAGLACLWVAMGRSAWFFSLWDLVHRLPVYRSLQVPSRFLMCVLLCVALFAGLGLSELEKKATTRTRRGLLALLLAVVGADLLAVDWPILANAFTTPPPVIARAEEFRQGGVAPADESFTHSAMYPALLANRGTIDSYDIVGVPRGAVRDSAKPGYRGEAFLADGTGSARVSSFSPNQVSVAYDAPGGGFVVLNQNWHRGWRARTGGAWAPAVPREGLAAAPVPPGRGEAVFRYRPPGLFPGLALTAAGLLAAAALLFPALAARLGLAR